ncbi:hypothetical protein [Streptomyces sp. NPDC049970]
MRISRDGTSAVLAQRKARREYENRVKRPSGRYNRTMTNLPSLLDMAGH